MTSLSLSQFCLSLKHVIYLCGRPIFATHCTNQQTPAHGRRLFFERNLTKLLKIVTHSGGAPILSRTIRPSNNSRNWIPPFLDASNTFRHHRHHIVKIFRVVHIVILIHGASRLLRDCQIHCRPRLMFNIFQSLPHDFLETFGSWYLVTEHNATGRNLE